jgi:hypothetical protein
MKKKGERALLLAAEIARNNALSFPYKVRRSSPGYAPVFSFKSS